MNSLELNKYLCTFLLTYRVCRKKNNIASKEIQNVRICLKVLLTLWITFSKIRSLNYKSCPYANGEWINLENLTSILLRNFLAICITIDSTTFYTCIAWINFEIFSILSTSIFTVSRCGNLFCLCLITFQTHVLGHTANFFMVNSIDFDYVINPTIVPLWFW